MRHLTRLGAGAAALATLTTLLTSTVLAGNFAEVTMARDSDDSPAAGEEREIRFSLLQHGVTPVEDGSVELIATLPGSDERISVEATSVGGGEWIASVTFPVEGDWQLLVTHSRFETSEPTTLAVGSAAGAAWLSSALAVGAVVVAAVVLGGTMLIGRTRRQSVGEATTTAARAG